MCWRRMVKISWTVVVRNEKVVHREKEKRNTLQTIKRRKGSWIGHILSRNCRLKHITAEKTEGETEVRETQRRIRKQLLDDHKKNEDTSN
jgi:predicted  nucleic acid-binding Zn-ribbon protein